MEFQFSSGMIWTLCNGIGCILITLVAIHLCKKAVAADRESRDGGNPYFIGIIACISLFVFMFTFLCKGGCEISSRLQW